MAPATFWAARKESALLDFLVAKRVEAGDGANSKAATFQKALEHLSPLLEHVPPKNAKSGQNKYGSVSVSYQPSPFMTDLTTEN